MRSRLSLFVVSAAVSLMACEPAPGTEDNSGPIMIIGGGFDAGTAGGGNGSPLPTGQDPDPDPDPGPDPDPDPDPGPDPDPDPGPDPDPAPGPDPAQAGRLGAACDRDADCEGGVCIANMPDGYCSQDCSDAQCPATGSCWNLGTAGTLCLMNCRRDSDCRDGYVCDGDNTCYPGTPDNPVDPPPAAGEGNVGEACAANADCEGANAQCVGEDQGFNDGYCVNFGCSQQNPCPEGGGCYQLQDGNTVCLAVCDGPDDCRPGYACDDVGACLPGCDADADCEAGQVCRDDATCGEPPCTPDSCPAGTLCSPGGQCVLDVGAPPRGPVPNCDNVAGWECAGGEAACGRLEQFLPVNGPGYWNYPLNGETERNQYRSFCRVDLQDLIKYAAAKVECLSRNWEFGNHEPLGLGDMSERNGAIPGTSVGQPGHPQNTHTNGFDMDIAYYQMVGDNRLRAVCNHVSGGRDQYHCVSDPENFDVWRTALFLGFLHHSPQLRVVGVDGRMGLMVDAAMDQLCDAGYLDGTACRGQRFRRLGYEVVDEGRGWYHFHHHHFHVSLMSRRDAGLNLSLEPVGRDACLTRDCAPMSIEHDERHHLDHLPAQWTSVELPAP